MHLTAITPRALTTAALTALDQATEDTIPQVTFHAPPRNPADPPCTITWTAGTALAVAGHLTATWHLHPDDAVTVLNGRVDSATFRHPRLARRARVTGALLRHEIVDLCGVDDCWNREVEQGKAVCIHHLTDPHAARAAAEEWARYQLEDVPVQRADLLGACRRSGLNAEETAAAMLLPTVEVERHWAPPTDEVVYDDVTGEASA